MSEAYLRCRYWPRCRIHLGQTPPRHFSPANRREMAELRSEGLPYADIAEMFGTSPYRVSEIVNQTQKPFG